MDTKISSVVVINYANRSLPVLRRIRRLLRLPSLQGRRRLDYGPGLRLYASASLRKSCPREQSCRTLMGRSDWLHVPKKEKIQSVVK